MVQEMEKKLLGKTLNLVSCDSEDYIELYNSRDTDCSLEGFQLDDNESLSDQR